MPDHLPKIVGGTLEQILAQPTLVGYSSFGEYQTIGRLTDAEESVKAKVTLSIHRDVQSGQRLLICLHLPLKRRTWKNVRSIYLVIPVDDLQIKPEVLSASHVARLRPDQLRRNGLDLDSKLLQVTMTLGCPAYAVMPSFPTGPHTPLDGLQQQLLLHWRNLSASTHMDLYLSDVSAITNFRTIETQQFITPELDLDHMYEGCRGVKNDWAQYPCDEDVRQPPGWNPCLDQPPPYHEAAPPPVDRMPSPDEITWGTSQPFDETKLFKDTGAICRPQKRKATEALADDGNSFQDVIPGTPTEADSSQKSTHFGDSHPSPHPWALQATEVEEAMRLSLIRRGDAASASKPINCALLQEPCLFLELQEWILKMWDYDSSAHDMHRDELLNLGSYARKNLVSLFDSTKAEMQLEFLEKVSRRLVVPGLRTSNLRLDAKHFHSWLEKRINRNAVTLLAEPLRDMHFTLREAVVRQVEESEARDFYEQKAKCCAIAFVTFGGRM